MISGAPAAGKGTQCAKIVEKVAAEGDACFSWLRMQLTETITPQYNLVHISVGDLLRDQVKQGTAAGKRAKDFMDKGVLVGAALYQRISGPRGYSRPLKGILQRGGTHVS